MGAFDVIHFNWGLHDVCPLVKPQLAQAGSGYAAVTEAQYVDNLEALYQQLNQQGEAHTEEERRVVRDVAALYEAMQQLQGWHEVCQCVPDGHPTCLWRHSS